jgi:hypothetical protein
MQAFQILRWLPTKVDREVTITFLGRKIRTVVFHSGKSLDKNWEVEEQTHRSSLSLSLSGSSPAAPTLTTAQIQKHVAPPSTSPEGAAKQPEAEHQPPGALKDEDRRFIPRRPCRVTRTCGFLEAVLSRA